jgi:hypothetical protein
LLLFINTTLREVKSQKSKSTEFVLYFYFRDHPE